jgi:hypothetical protein
MINLTDKEISMVRLAFDLASPEGEHRNATNFLIASLRRRGVTADQFLNNGGGSASYEALYQRVRMQVSGLQVQNASLMREKAELERKIVDLSARRAAQAQAQAAGSQTSGSTRTSRGSWQVTSSLLNFTRNPDTRNWYATDKAKCEFCIGRTKGRFCLWEKRGYWQTRWSTVAIFDTVAEAVAEAERRMSK